MDSGLDTTGKQNPGLSQGLRAASLNGTSAGLDPYSSAAIGAGYGAGGFDKLVGRPEGSMPRSSSLGLEGLGGRGHRINGPLPQRYEQLRTAESTSPFDSYMPSLQRGGTSGLEAYMLGGLGSLSPGGHVFRCCAGSF